MKKTISLVLGAMLVVSGMGLVAGSAAADPAPSADEPVVEAPQDATPAFDGQTSSEDPCVYVWTYMICLD